MISRTIDKWCFYWYMDVMRWCCCLSRMRRFFCGTCLMGSWCPPVSYGFNIEEFLIALHLLLPVWWMMEWWNSLLYVMIRLSFAWLFPRINTWTQRNESDMGIYDYHTHGSAPGSAQTVSTYISPKKCHDTIPHQSLSIIELFRNG